MAGDGVTDEVERPSGRARRMWLVGVGTGVVCLAATTVFTQLPRRGEGVRVVSASGQVDRPGRQRAAPTTSTSRIARSAPLPSVASTLAQAAVTTVAPAGQRAIDGDIDGDGLVDEVSVAVRGGAVALETRLSRLGPQTAVLGEVDPSAAEVLGVVDAFGDGFGVVFVRARRGASTEFTTAVRLVDGRLRQLEDAHGDQTFLALGYGGSVRTFGSVACDDDRSSRGGGVLVHDYGDNDGVTSDSGAIWHMTRVAYRYEGTATLVRSPEQRYETDAAGAQRIFANASCGSLRLPASP